jgi:Protein of unknown function (DUF3892)
MADSIQVLCVNKTNRMSPYERIHNIGGVNPNGTRWKLSEADAIKGINQGRWAFFVERPTGHSVNVVVATSPYGNPYLKTEADGEHPNNLLSLPECP